MRFTSSRLEKIFVLTIDKNDIARINISYVPYIYILISLECYIYIYIHAYIYSDITCARRCDSLLGVRIVRRKLTNNNSKLCIALDV